MENPSGRFTMPLFVFGNGLFMTYVVVSVFLATTLPSQWTLVLGLSTASWIFANFLLHAGMTLYTGVYAPGLVTAAAIHAPLSVYIYGTAWQAGEPALAGFVLSILIGFAVMYGPQLNAVRVYRADRWRQAQQQGQNPSSP